MKLPPAWYAIGLSKDIKNKHGAYQRFGEDLLVFRDANQQICIFKDRCPHRSAKLSAGRLVNHTIECPFHGFRFDESGSCVEAPEFNHALPKLCLKKYYSYEECGVIWMWWGDAEPSGNKPQWFTETFNKCSSSFSESWPCHFSRCVENQLDYAHLPFVHRNSIGRFTKIGRKADVKFTKESIILGFEAKDFIQFRYPNLWIISINKWHYLSLIFAPVNEHKTEMILQAHQSYIKFPGLAKMVSGALVLNARKILQEDKRVVLGQNPDNSFEASDEQLFANDAAIRQFRQWLRQEQVKGA